MIKVADNVKLEVSRAAVTQVLDKGETPEQEDK
jgi:preprotein translocase subunit YajC